MVLPISQKPFQFLGNKNKHGNCQSAFTLIELLVVFAVGVVLSTIGLASYISFGHSQSLNTAVSDVITMLSTARFRAQHQVKTTIDPLCITNVGVLDNWEVYVVSTTQYQLRETCSATKYEKITNKLPTDVTIVTANSATEIQFPVITGGAIALNAAGDFTPSQIELISSNNTCRLISVNTTTGNISVTTPAAC